jgi:cytochrome aa3-600 menaquinol oxidase subunit II
VKKQALLNRIIVFAMAALATVLLAGCENSKYIVLDPKGPVGETQMNLIWISIILCAIIIIPVLIIFAYIVYRFRDTPGNKAPYTPDWADSKVLETIWWGIPILLIAVLGYYTARDTYALEKPAAVAAHSKPITVQVTSLDWKWLFQYPEQGIATVNHLEIPTGVPVNFVLTSDAPMNSFWIPQLGGQKYTMGGMAMKLWLQADKPGEYFGSGANFSGEGFADMRFKVVAKPQAEFDAWVKQVKQEGAAQLTKADYEKLAKPATSNEIFYSSYQKGLFEYIVNKNSHSPSQPNHRMEHGQNPEMKHNENQSNMSGHDMPGMNMNQ